ncbi:glyoxalase-bleomycin resistance protein-dioxygenase [Candidatus Micropelagos thuwalensis]|uniref:Glyoxalase-bleomycin resistance protein-dioxygenase n=1 Tax=Candidatus Micropelagius thuwalensis TaxID=1397666 RepID=U2XQJ7_9PROT|nr:serine hydrolase [Candidatus Micropelagos thuwalensis]ERL47392.1 glyoxalase-bleomycin resistance protein-dioxygenase [Candidatus Micropelagos thuwalensis]
MNKRPKRFRKFLILLVVSIIITTSWVIYDYQFLKRYFSFIHAGGDPHVIGLSWYNPRLIISKDSPENYASDQEINTKKSSELSKNELIFDKVADYALNDSGQAILISRYGKIVYERYQNDTTRETLINPQSMSKSLLALAIGYALTQGDIKSLDTPISEYLPDLSKDRRGSITVKNLLQMSAGLEQISKDYSPYPWSRGVRQHFGTDFDYWVMQLQSIDPPGTMFEYNNNESNLLGMVLEKAVGMSYQEYLSKEIWPAFGLGKAEAYLDKENGSIMKSCCIFSRPIDWLKLGQIILDKGEVNQKQVISEEYITQMTNPSPTNQGYGYQLWLKPLELRGGYVGEPVPKNPQIWWSSEIYLDTVYNFSGYGHHKTWIIPSLDMVVVRINGNNWPKEPFDQSKIPNMLIRSLGSTQS